MSKVRYSGEVTVEVFGREDHGGCEYVSGAVSTPAGVRTFAVPVSETEEGDFLCLFETARRLDFHGDEDTITSMEPRRFGGPSIDVEKWGAWRRHDDRPHLAVTEECRFPSPLRVVGGPIRRVG